MKYLFSLIIALLMLTATATAQNTVIYTQPIEGKVVGIYINPGWKVTLVPRTDDSTLVSFVMPQPATYSQIPDSIFYYNARKHALILKRAPLHMEGQEVIIHSNFAKKYLTLNNRATAYAQNLTIGEKTLELNQDARLVVDTLHGEGECDVAIKMADLIVNTLEGDTISLDCRGTSRIDIKNYMQKELNVTLYSNHGDCYTFPDSTRVVRLRHNAFLCDADTLRKIYVDDRDKNIWARQLHFRITWYNRFNHSSLPGASPYKLSDDAQYGLRYDLSTRFLLAPKWMLSTGLRYDMSISPLFNQVTADENGLLQIAPPSITPSRIVESRHYLGIPVQLFWTIESSTQTSLSLDLFAGVNLIKNYAIKEFYADPNTSHLSQERQKSNYCNPFKLEASFSMNSLAFAFLRSMRFYFNLLPEYRRSTGLPKVHTYGMEFSF